jgi:hypothetical protein
MAQLAAAAGPAPTTVMQESLRALMQQPLVQTQPLQVHSSDAMPHACHQGTVHVAYAQPRHPKGFDHNKLVHPLSLAVLSFIKHDCLRSGRAACA